MIEVTETVVKSYDLDGLIERVKSVESSLDAIKFYDFMLLICLVLFVLSCVLFAAAHFKCCEFGWWLRLDISHHSHCSR